MKTRISEKKLKSLYQLLSDPMIDFDCGELCAPGNGGIPVCCANEDVVPVLFNEEYKYHWKNGRFWKRMPPINKEIKKFIEEAEDYYVFAKCPGPAGCERSKRALNCRTFPLEPYLDKDGGIMGLAYSDTNGIDCPLIGKPMKIFNPVYVRNVIKFWEEMFEYYPEEKETYMEESRKRDRRIKRLKLRQKRLSILRKVK
ncbi:hypothetical protein BMS3Bbin09_00391 [bacterium BMS3Bbin09]|nr:hypothetical protein BMS3Bbin09_00391 [bacterium BMS3Bbin09]